MRVGKLGILVALFVGNAVVMLEAMRASFASPAAAATLWLAMALASVMEVLGAAWIFWSAVLLWRDRQRRRELVVEAGHVRGTWFVTGLVGSFGLLPAVLLFATAPMRAFGESGPSLLAGLVLWWFMFFLPVWLLWAIPTALEEMQRQPRPT